METREYKTVDKSNWGPGPWQDEPDKMQWTDESTGMPCLIVRGSSGALCGYVGVSEEHPYFGQSYEEPLGDCTTDCDAIAGYHSGHCVGSRVKVHGGLTFANFCAANVDESVHICHVPAPGEPDHVWWLGFDCAHGFDYRPAHSEAVRELGFEVWFDAGADYRDIAYVKAEVTSLAHQLKAAV